MEKNERIKRLKEARRNFLLFVSLFVVCFSMFLLMTIETNRIAINLFIASDNVVYTDSLNQTSAWESAHETYVQSMTVRQSMYQSDFWYTRWFAYTLGTSVVGKLIRLAILLFLNYICFFVISLTLKLIGEIISEAYQSFEEKKTARRKTKNMQRRSNLYSVPARYNNQVDKFEAINIMKR